MGEILRGAAIGAICLTALICVGCSKKEPTAARIEGLEPQRLSFGAPEEVQTAFTEKMKACWFSLTSPILRGFQFTAAPVKIETGDGEVEVEQITIASGPGEGAQRFTIQFHPFNENTLITTRNISFPPPLAERLESDVGSWILSQSDCEEAGDPYGKPALPPQLSSTPQQGGIPPSAGPQGWDTQLDSTVSRP